MIRVACLLAALATAAPAQSSDREVRPPPPLSEPVEVLAPRLDRGLAMVAATQGWDGRTSQFFRGAGACDILNFRSTVWASPPAPRSPAGVMSRMTLGCADEASQHTFTSRIGPGDAPAGADLNEMMRAELRDKLRRHYAGQADPDEVAALKAEVAALTQLVDQERMRADVAAEALAEERSSSAEVVSRLDEIEAALRVLKVAAGR